MMKSEMHVILVLYYDVLISAWLLLAPLSLFGAKLFFQNYEVVCVCGRGD